MPCGPLADDWLFWDPETIADYPHSCSPRYEQCPLDEELSRIRDPQQLELFASQGDE
jgi:hypothetical protein